MAIDGLVVENRDSPLGRSTMPQLYLVAGVTMAGVSAVFALFAELEKRYDLSTTSIGWIAGSAFLASLVAQLWLSRYADRGYATSLLKAGVVAAAAGLLWFAAATELWQFVAARALLGAGVGMIVPPARRAIVITADGAPGERLGTFYAAYLAGFVFGPPIAGLLTVIGDVRLPFLVFGLLVLGTLLTILRLRLPEAPVKPVDRAVEPDGTHATAGTERPAGTPAADDDRRVLRRLVRNRRIIAALLVVVSFRYSIGVFEPLWATHLDNLGASTTVVSLSLASFALPMLLVAKPAGRLSDRLGPRLTSLVAALITVPLMATYGYAGIVWLILALAVPHGLLEAILSPGSQAAIADAASDDDAASAQGLAEAAGSAAAAVGAFTAPALFDWLGPGPAWLIAALVMLGLLTTSWTMDPPETSKTGRTGPDAQPIRGLTPKPGPVAGIATGARSGQAFAMANLPLIEAPEVDYGDDEAAMVRYRREGTERALALGNRGPIRFDDEGNLDPAILDAYSEHGFYIFEGVLGPEERADLEADVADMLDRAPVTKDAPLDRHGRPALGAGLRARNVTWVRPLSDPVGGTGAANGRHPAKMIEPTAPDGSPEWVVQLILGSLQFSEACLRTYCHPHLLAVAAAINGEDFTPFNEAVWVKQPRLGGSVAWHQDGWTHWDSPDLDEGTHGFNFMGQLYGCDAANGLWVVPGSHRSGKADIKAMVAAAGSDRLPDAVPLICSPGDVAITNRQAVHGSFANTSPDVRVTINFGFHRRASVLNVTSGGVHSPVTTYDEDYIGERSKLIMYGIDARSRRFPDEERFRYRPFAGMEGEFRWGPEAKAAIEDYNLRDLGI